MNLTEKVNAAIANAVAEYEKDVREKVNSLLSKYGLSVDGPLGTVDYNTDCITYCVIEKVKTGTAANFEIVYFCKDTARAKAGDMCIGYMCDDWVDCPDIETAIYESRLYNAWVASMKNRDKKCIPNK